MKDVKKQKQPQVTNMAAAMMRGLQDCVNHGRNPGRIGAFIVKATAKGVGIKGNGHHVHKIAA